MEAPDKIFINEDVIALHILQTKYDGDIEYIRKDTMLDWIKAQLKENEEWREVCPDDRFFGGEEVAYDYVIEMINKL